MAKILVIDDDEQIRAVLGKMLQVAGHEVAAAADGAEGLEAFGRQPFDLIISDVLMPKKGGPETIAALRSIRPGLKIIATYGGGHLAGVDSLVTAESLGADRLLAKPIPLEELLATVSDLLKAEQGGPDRS